MKSPKTKLGILYIVLAVATCIGGGIASKKNGEEVKQEKMVEIYYDRMSALGNASVQFRTDPAATEYMNAQISEARREWYQETEKLDRIKNRRTMRTAAWFVPAGILLICGLTISVSGSSKPTN